MAKPTAQQLEVYKKGIKLVPYLQLLDIELESLGDGTAEMSVEIQKKHLQPMGIAHGGVIASLLDSVTWWAARAAQESDSANVIVSVDLKLNYLSALKPGRAIARAHCKKSGSRLCYAVGEILDANGRLVADGSSTLMITRG